MLQTVFSIMPPYTDIIYNSQPLTISQNYFNEFKIRLMRESDVDIVSEIDRITWNESSWPSGDFFKALYNPFWSCWVLKSTTHDHAILGYGLQYLSHGRSHIANFCIHPNQRGRGLGGILLRHMIDHARRIGVSIVELEVNTTNINAYNLYVKHGFRKIYTLERYYSETEDAYLMQLIIRRTD
jgi:ribosomal-protein-alanine N-acetyltransferase